MHHTSVKSDLGCTTFNVAALDRSLQVHTTSDRRLFSVVHSFIAVRRLHKTVVVRQDTNDDSHITAPSVRSCVRIHHLKADLLDNMCRGLTDVNVMDGSFCHIITALSDVKLESALRNSLCHTIGPPEFTGFFTAIKICQIEISK